MAGILGIDPGPLTLRELVAMVDGRQRDNWSHTAQMMAFEANINRDPKKTRAFNASDFYPFRAAHREEPIKVNDLSILKRVFVDRKKGEGE